MKKKRKDKRRLPPGLFSKMEFFDGGLKVHRLKGFVSSKKFRKNLRDFLEGYGIKI